MEQTTVSSPSSPSVTGSFFWEHKSSSPKKSYELHPNSLLSTNSHDVDFMSKGGLALSSSSASSSSSSSNSRRTNSISSGGNTGTRINHLNDLRPGQSQSSQRSKSSDSRSDSQENSRHGVDVPKEGPILVSSSSSSTSNKSSEESSPSSDSGGVETRYDGPFYNSRDSSNIDQPALAFPPFKMSQSSFGRR